VSFVCGGSWKFQSGCLEELTEFAKHQFALNRQHPDGSTERDHLESVERQTGRRPSALDGPPLPYDIAHVWLWFNDLSAARGNNGWGPNALNYQDMAAWMMLTGTIVRPQEISAILMLDRLWMSEQAKATAAARKAKG